MRVLFINATAAKLSRSGFFLIAGRDEISSHGRFTTFGSGISGFGKVVFLLPANMRVRSALRGETGTGVAATMVLSSTCLLILSMNWLESERILSQA